MQRIVLHSVLQRQSDFVTV